MQYYCDLKHPTPSIVFNQNVNAAPNTCVFDRMIIQTWQDRRVISSWENIKTFFWLWKMQMNMQTKPNEQTPTLEPL